MAVKARSTTIETFPNQQTILNYISTHWVNKEIFEMPKMTENFPDATQKVAKYFADKKMEREEIHSHVKEALSDEDTKKNEAILDTLKQMVSDLELKDKENGTTSYSTIESKSLLASMEVPGLLEKTILMYSEVLKDLLDKATFSPPAPGETCWKKNLPVQNLTNQ